MIKFKANSIFLLSKYKIAILLCFILLLSLPITGFFAFGANKKINATIDNEKPEINFSKDLTLTKSQNQQDATFQAQTNIYSFDELKNSIENSTNQDILLNIKGNIDQTMPISVSSNKHITLLGSLNENLKITKKNDFNGAMFDVEPNASLTICNMTIDGGAVWQKVLKSKNFGIESKYGAINVKKNANVTINNLILCNFSCIDKTSALEVDNGGTAQINNSFFMDNKAITNGGAIKVLGTAKLSDVAISNNISDEFGGGVYVSQNASFSISNKIYIYDNMDKKGKSNLFTDTSADKFIIDKIIDKSSKVGLSCKDTIVSNKAFASKSNVYEADFGSCRNCFVFDNTIDYFPYCRYNKLIAEQVNKKNGNILGDGTADNPYEISKAADLQLINEQTSSNFKIVNALNLADCSPWKPLCSDPSKPFTGTLYGYDPEEYIHIFNLIYDGSNQNADDLDGWGLFYAISNSAKISYITLDGNIKINSKLKYVGGFAAKVVNSSSRWDSLDETSNIVSCDSNVDFVLPDISENKNIVCGGFVGLNSGGVSRCKFGGKILDLQKGQDIDYIFTNFLCVGTITGVVDWKHNDSVKMLPENITCHSGSMSGEDQNSIEDICGMINIFPDIFEVDVKIDGKGQARCAHSEVVDSSPFLKDVLLMMISSNDSQYRDHYASTTKRYRENISVQLDLKGQNSVYVVVPLLEELSEKYNFPLNRIFIAGDTAYEWIYGHSGIIIDNNSITNILDRAHKLCDKGLMWGVNAGSLYNSDAINRNDPEVLRRFFNDLGFEKGHHKIAVNANHSEIRSYGKGWEWLANNNIDTSLYVIDDEHSLDINFNRGLWNVTTRKKGIGLDRRNERRNLIYSCVTTIGLPLVGNSKVLY